jgi:hypothetical protein
MGQKQASRKRGGDEVGYEDNFGCYDLSFPLEGEFLADVRARSKRINCTICDVEVYLLPSRNTCQLCDFNMEMGWPR